MKKIYFLALSVFMAGGIMAQSATTNTDKTTLNKKNVTSFSVGSKTSNSNENTNSNSKVGVDQTTTKKEVTQTGSIGTSKTNAANKPEVDLPGFPVIENTGDSYADKVNYIAARDKWISENQEIYNNYINSKK